MTELDPKLLELLTTSPFMTVEPGATVIIAIGADWDMDQVNSLGTYLHAWNDTVNWQALQGAGFAGVIHVKAAPSTTE